MKRPAMAMVAVLALAGGACGGDDDGDVTDDAAATTDESSGDDDSASGDDSSGAWCDLARDLENNTPFDDIDITDPEAVEIAYEEILNIMDDAAELAPDEIKADFAIVVVSAKRAVEALKEVDFDRNAVDQSIFDDPEAVAAGTRLDEYGERVCGFDDTGDVIELTVPENIGDDTGTTDLNGDDGSFDEDTVRAEIITQLVAVGLTEVQATCMVDNVADLEDFARTGASDETEFNNLVELCEIDVTQLQAPGG